MNILIVASETVGETLRDVHLAFTGVRCTLIRHWNELQRLAESRPPTFCLIILEGSSSTMDGGTYTGGSTLRRMVRTLDRVTLNAPLVLFTDSPWLSEEIRRIVDGQRTIHIVNYLPDDAMGFVPCLAHAVHRILHNRIKNPAP